MIYNLLVMLIALSIKNCYRLLLDQAECKGVSYQHRARTHREDSEQLLPASARNAGFFYCPCSA